MVDEYQLGLLAVENHRHGTLTEFLVYRERKKKEAVKKCCVFLSFDPSIELTQRGVVGIHIFGGEELADEGGFAGVVLP